MLLAIHDFKQIAEIQEDFNQSFPNLEIRFYSKPQHYKKASDESTRIDPKKYVGQIRKLHRNGELPIMSWYTVEKVEGDFKELFGLNVRIFRKEKNGFVQTSATDRYTLREQEDLAKGPGVLIHRRVSGQLGGYKGL